MHCYLQLQLFAKQQAFHLTLDRLTLRGFIGAVCYLAGQELPFRDHDGSPIIINVGNFLEFLNVWKNFGSILENHMNSATVI